MWRFCPDLIYTAESGHKLSECRAVWMGGAWSGRETKHASNEPRFFKLQFNTFSDFNMQRGFSKILTDVMHTLKVSLFWINKTIFCICIYGFHSFIPASGSVWVVLAVPSSRWEGKTSLICRCQISFFGVLELRHNTCGHSKMDFVVSADVPPT